jgi:hypothetical protein
MNMTLFELLAALFVTMKLGNIGDFADWSWWEVICLHAFCMITFWVINRIVDAVINFWRER